MTPSKPEVEALLGLLEQAGLEPADLLTAITTLADAKKTAQKKVDTDGKTKNVLNKELVYPDENAIIYQRGDVKSNVYYFRTYDPITRKQYVKSLGTNDRVKALATARNLYQQILGKIDRQERLSSITTDDLIRRHTEKLEARTNKTGMPNSITPDTLRVKMYYLSNWKDYICSLGYEKTTIDRIPKHKVRDFGDWFFNLPKRSGNINTPRCIEQINNAVGEVVTMYRKTAYRDRFISLEQIPDIDRLDDSKDKSYKRDILTEQQYEKFWKYMEYVYIKGKKLDDNGNKVVDPLSKRDPNELLKRKIFAKSMGVLYNTGLRPSELLGIRWSDISSHTTGSDEDRKKNYKITVRPEVAKTGVKRIIVAPVKKRLDIIRSSYKEMGVDVKPTDFILQNPATGAAYTRANLYMRLKRVIAASGLEDELGVENKKLSLYSSRHFFITMRLRYGKVPLYLLSKVVGSSVKNLTDVYGHIDTELEADVITRGMGRLTKTGFDVDTDVSVLE